MSGTAGPATMQRVAARSVHVLTASGAVWALLALDATARGRFKAALVWITVALLVDAVDGSLARRFRVASVLPSLDGTLLDNLMDYLNYVLVPAYLILEADLVPPGFGLPAAILICLASAFQFTHAEAKTADHHFRGFPSCWNFVAFYLLLLRPGAWWTLGWIVALSVLTFVPIRFVYPSRTREQRSLTSALTIVWGIAILVLLVQFPSPSTWLLYGSLLYVIYYLVVSLVHTSRLVSSPQGDGLESVPPSGEQ